MSRSSAPWLALFASIEVEKSVDRGFRWRKTSGEFSWTPRVPHGQLSFRTTFARATMAELDFVKLFTDGACSGNPGPGGWAYILQHPASGRVMEISTTEPAIQLYCGNFLIEVLHFLDSLERAIKVRPSKFD